MADNAPAQEEASRRRRRRGLLALLLSLSLVTLGSGALSLAIFTDSDAATGSFTTGTIDIAVNPTALFSVGAMMPDDTVDASLTVANGGTASLRYAMTTADDGDPLADQLEVEIKTEGSGCGAFDGTTLYGSAAMSAAAFGNPAQGSQGGDRTLAAGASEVLCFRAWLPDTTGNAFQGATTDVTFTFDAEQTANNP
jgi:predicted ribosomally synthesized peptide with SipW-like signal peptide